MRMRGMVFFGNNFILGYVKAEGRKGKGRELIGLPTSMWFNVFCLYMFKWRERKRKWEGMGVYFGGNGNGKLRKGRLLILVFPTSSLRVKLKGREHEGQRGKGVEVKE